MKILFARLEGPTATFGRVRGWVFALAVLLASAAVVYGVDSSAAEAPWVVHEWGTFTSLQDETGKAIGGINTDDEPVPKFVHRLADFLLLSPTEVPASFFKGAPSCHSDVTMRLETPVLYFHPSPSQPEAQDVSVTAEFRGGWLSEFYPNAEAHAPGVGTNGFTFGPLRSSTVGTLAWKNLRVGGNWTGPVTDQHVWTSPRAVQAAAVQTVSGEAEKFLFYRGVAHIDAPLAVSQDAKAAELVFRSQCAPEIAGTGLKVWALWLVDIRADGRVAFRIVPSMTLTGKGSIAGKVSSRFSPGDYSAENREKLKMSLQGALVSEGLFGDEAQALLNTWEVSYFKSAGLRVFFLVPRAWTDFYLPLKISTPAETTRVMVGRIELVTPVQQEILRQIGKLSTKDIVKDAGRLQTNYYGQIKPGVNDLEKVNAGTESLAAFGVAVPKSYQLYLQLGRFRNALILDEANKHPASGLNSFITQYNLAGYKPVDLSLENGKINGAP